MTSDPDTTPYAMSGWATSPSIPLPTPVPTQSSTGTPWTGSASQDLDEYDESHLIRGYD
jgi:hypothetical protein